MTDLPSLHPETPARLALSSREAATTLGVSERTLFSWTASGLLPRVKIGGRVMFRVADIEALLSRHIQGGAQ